VDVVVTTREGRLFAWRTKGPADQDIGWASIHHDPQNTGNAGTPLMKQVGPPRVADDGADGCCEGGEQGAVLLLAPLALFYRRRRSA
jgi:hypothetical protein